MTYDDFNASLDGTAPPDGCDSALAALWHAAKGDWETAHGFAQDQDDADGAWVHAHLHREEGDLDNAGYWYRRAGRAPADGALEAEREAIARALLARRDTASP